jgi:hypothetical protein
MRPVPHPFDFFLSKGWETTETTAEGPDAIHPSTLNENPDVVRT